MKRIEFKLTVAALVILALGGIYLSVFAQTETRSVSKALAKIGYQVKSRSAETPTDWETEQFQTLSKTTYRVKRKTALAGNQKNMFPRFEVTEEIYADEKSAEARMKRIREKPPNLSIEKREYWMVRGFRHAEKVYFISTDAVIFYEGIGDFAEQLDNAIKP